MISYLYYLGYYLLRTQNRVSEKIPAVLQETDGLLEKVKFKRQKIEVDNTIILTLNKAPEILNETFLRDKELEKNQMTKLKKNIILMKF